MIGMTKHAWINLFVSMYTKGVLCMYIHTIHGASTVHARTNLRIFELESGKCARSREARF